MRSSCAQAALRLRFGCVWAALGLAVAGGSYAFGPLCTVTSPPTLCVWQAISPIPRALLVHSGHFAPTKRSIGTSQPRQASSRNRWPRTPIALGRYLIITICTPWILLTAIELPLFQDRAHINGFTQRDLAHTIHAGFLCTLVSCLFYA